MKNKSGRTFIIFLGLIVVVLVSGICISVFLLRQESQNRVRAEEQITSLQDSEKKMAKELEELKKQLYILNEKNKEADEKINNLLDDLELEEGLREQLREENTKLKNSVEQADAEKEKLRQAMATELEDVQRKLKEANDQIQSVKASKEELQQKIVMLEGEKRVVEEQLKELETEALNNAKQEDPEKIAYEMYERSKLREERMPASPVGVPSPIELDPIVIDNAQGRVLSVDTRTEFLIFDLGLEDDIRPGQVVSIYRGDKFLGDVKVSRVQDKMSAADFIPPFSSTKVRKNDIVVVKPF